jgi:glycosyltransferase involved in cell wall biosynthesis
MNSVSVTIISRNEAQNIEACLDSVGWAYEVVLVDQFSDDGTAGIAEKSGAKVFQENWKGYAGQKNSAIEKATGNWILSLDADERVTNDLKLEIESVVNSSSPMDGHYIPRKNFFCGQWIRHGGWYPDYNLRLFRKGTGCFQERAVHEKIILNGRLGYLKNPLEHYTYRSIKDYIERLERYSRLSAAEISDRSRWSRWHTLTLRPLFTFLNMYLFRRGILDGSAGLFLAVSYAYYTFLKYYRFYEENFDN